METVRPFEFMVSWRYLKSKRHQTFISLITWISVGGVALGVMALIVVGLVGSSLTNAMLAIAFFWWPWYTRLLYNITRQLKNEGYVTAAEVVGASHWHILIKEILPNCVPSLLTKMTLDMSFVILVAASLGFLGLGVRAPTPELGSMIAEGANYLPAMWWLPVFAGLGILIAVLGFNLVGDGLRDLLDVEV